MTRTTIPALARACLALGALAVATAGLAAAGPARAAAAATPAVLYAYAAGTAASPASCPQDTTTPADPSAECSLAEALALAAPGDTIDLATPGATAHYVGNWAVSTPATTATAPVTIQAVPGLASPPVLDGDGPDAPAGEACSTTSCNGPVLTVPAGEYVALTEITIANGQNSGLKNAGKVTISRSTFTGNAAFAGGAIDTGDGGGGTVSVTGSTFTRNTASFGGGAISSGISVGGGGTVTVTGSTFTGNTATVDGGAINSGEDGGGSVTVTASTFAANSAVFGGAIASGENSGGGNVSGGTLTVTASTFAGNTATADGGAIDSGDNFGGFGTVQVAGDVFDGSCDRRAGTWTDGGYNAGSDGSCFNSGTRDINAGSAAGLKLGALADNGGPTHTIKPKPGSPVTGIIPDPVTVSFGGSPVVLCPATDQRGEASAAHAECDAGAVQTTGRPLAVTTASLPGGTAGRPYSAALAAAGGAGPYTWSAASGALPPGLTLSPGGVLSGTPARVGRFAVTVQVSDTAFPAMAVTKRLPVTVHPRNPVITARATSQYPKTTYGWYRSPVTITFTCTPGSAPLTAPCPPPVTLTRNGAGQPVTRTIDGTDGGTATATLAVSIDQAPPTLTVTGATDGALVEAPGPRIACTATGGLSGLTGPCTLRITRTETAIAWTATATSKAGLTTTTRGRERLLDFYVAKAPYARGRFTVTIGTYTVKAYLLTATGAPRYVDAAPQGEQPHPVGAKMTKIGPHLWAITVRFTTKMASKYKYWTLGILVHDTLHTIPVTLRR